MFATIKEKLELIAEARRARAEKKEALRIAADKAARFRREERRRGPQPQTGDFVIEHTSFNSAERVAKMRDDAGELVLKFGPAKRSACELAAQQMKVVADATTWHRTRRGYLVVNY